MYPSNLRVPARTIPRHLFSYVSVLFIFSCHSPKVGQTYWFIRNGNWDNPYCWRDKNMPGKTIAAGDTVHILSTAETGVDSLMDYGVVIVDGGLVIGPNCFVATGGNMFFSKTSIMLGNGYLGVGGTLQIASQAFINFAGVLETVPGGTTTNNGRMQCGSLLIGGGFTNGPSGQISILPNYSASITANGFYNAGAMIVQGKLDFVGWHPDNGGTIRCEQNGALWIEANTYLESGGLIQLVDNSSLNIPSGGYLEVDGNLTTDKNTVININGYLTNEGYIQNNGVVINAGSYLMSAGTQKKTPAISPELNMMDTFYNGSMFQVAVGNVTGAGPLVNYFGVTPQGYTGPAINYQITSQPVNFNCGSPCIATFTVGAGGGPVSYQWQYSGDGKTWNPVPAGPPFSGSKSNVLTITNPGSPYQTVPYRCQLTGMGRGNIGYSNIVDITLGAKK